MRLPCEQGEGTLFFSSIGCKILPIGGAMKVGIVKDDIYLEHITDDFHPENPRRLAAIYEMLERMDQTGLVYVPARPATADGDSPKPRQAYIR